MFMVRAGGCLEGKGDSPKLESNPSSPDPYAAPTLHPTPRLHFRVQVLTPGALRSGYQKGV